MSLYDLMEFFSTLLVLFTGLTLVLYGRGLEAIGIRITVIHGDFLGLERVEWTLLHLLFGWLWVVISIFHLKYNWKVFRLYFKKPNPKTANKKIVSSILLAFFVVFLVSGLVIWISRSFINPVSEDFSPEAASALLIYIGKRGQGAGLGGGESASGVTAIHTLIGLIFLGLVIYHLSLNWKTFKAYFRIKKEKPSRNKKTPTNVASNDVSSKNKEGEKAPSRSEHEKEIKKKKRMPRLWPFRYGKELGAALLFSLTYLIGILYYSDFLITVLRL